MQCEIYFSRLLIEYNKHQYWTKIILSSTIISYVDVRSSSSSSYTTSKINKEILNQQIGNQPFRSIELNSITRMLNRRIYVIKAKSYTPRLQDVKCHVIWEIFPNFTRDQNSFSIKNLRQVIGIYCIK